ncbi:hypothetical protein [Rhizobium sp. 007]|uniref:hypothetical protein n=1 Tax=Rhizobium sp. 007 TaxID=2785056 RepID=UPI00189068AE|nr:hypothetical protein [Rhizobium sp. 007]QPB22163.1 hypothetical protein ISN39_05190 [Rhizobium sp. 007]
MRMKLLAASILALGMATSASYAQSQGAPASSTNSPPSVQEGETNLSATIAMRLLRLIPM